MQRRIFIVDDHEAVRQAYIQLFELTDDLEVVGDAATAEQALKALRVCRPDLVLVDILLPGMDGIELIARLRDVLPDVPVLAVSGEEEAVYAERALRAGAWGYVPKRQAAERLLEAVDSVLSGCRYLNGEVGPSSLPEE